MMNEASFVTASMGFQPIEGGKLNANVCVRFFEETPALKKVVALRELGWRNARLNPPFNGVYTVEALYRVFSTQAEMFEAFRLAVEA